MYSKVSLLFAKVTRYTREFCVYSRSNHFAFIAKFLRYIDHDTFNFFYENKLLAFKTSLVIVEEHRIYFLVANSTAKKVFRCT